MYRIKFYLRLYFSKWPEIYLFLYKVFGKTSNFFFERHSDLYSAQPVVSTTDLVIEGFPRCANSFSVRAFYFDGINKNIQLAHHLHSSSQIIYAARHKIPAIVLIRKPEEAIVSYLLRTPIVTPKMAIDGYLSFYSNIQPYKDQFILADFDAVTSDFGLIILRVNEKFNVNFEVFTHTRENVDKCFRLSEVRNKMTQQGREEMMARPSIMKNEMKNKLRYQLESENCKYLLTKANYLYNYLKEN